MPQCSHPQVLLRKLVSLTRCSPVILILRVVPWIRKICRRSFNRAVRSMLFCHGTAAKLLQTMFAGFDSHMDFCSSRSVDGADQPAHHAAPENAYTTPHLSACMVPLFQELPQVLEPEELDEAVGIISRHETPTFTALRSSPHRSAFFTIAPEPHFQRYERNVTMHVYLVTKTAVYMTLEPCTRSLARDVPVDWTAHVHPEGALYYAHNTMNIFTDSPLHDKSAFEIAMSFIRQIEEYRAANGILADDEVDLVLDLVTDENGKPACGYYLADHRQRIIFWYDAFDLRDLPRFEDVYGVRSPHHISITCNLFPSTLPVTRELVCELRDTVAYSVGVTESLKGMPVQSSHLPPFFFPQMISCSSENTEACYGGTACIISRFMWAFACRKFYNFHGEPCARLEKERSVFGHITTRSLIFRILGLLLFNAPWTHLRALEEVWVDEKVSVAPWRRIVDTLCIEWQELILYATVLLNANVAFLAIPTIDDGSHIYARSISQIASYVSVITSLGSVIVGLILVRQNRSHKDGAIDVVAAFLGKNFHERLGFESLALQNSLPFALLMWGSIAFFIAFLAMCFQSSDGPARLVVACSTALLLVLGGLWCFLLIPVPLVRSIRARLEDIRARQIWKRVAPGRGAV
ncbi:hypothetical protein B0H14DRAFT_3063488 [Mycena olivaceomarginata]|nr:hypothetical protein B0H14DRAFT_3063488 [Mycena olivaceomarginata]